MRRFDTVLQQGLGLASAIVLFAMMWVTAIDVAGRYLFNKPLPGGFELTELMLAALIYCGLPLVSARRDHIVIDTLESVMSSGLKRVLDIAAELICAVALGGVGYLLFRRAARVAEYGDTTAVLKLPLTPVVYLMASMITIAALIHLALVFVPPAARPSKSSA